MKDSIHFYLKNAVLSAALTIVFLAPAYGAEQTTLSAKDDYITCWKQPCIYTAGSAWSEKNPSGVAVSVAMGTKSIVTDNEIKTILTNDFKHYGVTTIKFFFEQNDALATGVGFHIRGGTDGLYFVTEMREQISKLANRATNDNPLFSLSQ